MATDVMRKSKKESLVALEEALKRKLSELHELCLQESELTDRSTQKQRSSIMPEPHIRRRPLPTPTIPNLNSGIDHIDAPSSTSNRMNHVSTQPHAGFTPSSGRPTAAPRPLPLLPTVRHQTLKSHDNSTGTNPHDGSRVSVTQSQNHYYSSLSSSSSTSSFGSDERRKLRQARLEQLAKSVLTQTQYEGLETLKNSQPLWQESKPYELSDFYKYSAKHRRKNVEDVDNR